MRPAEPDLVGRIGDVGQAEQAVELTQKSRRGGRVEGVVDFVVVGEAGSGPRGGDLGQACPDPLVNPDRLGDSAGGVAQLEDLVVGVGNGRGRRLEQGGHPEGLQAGH